MARKKNEGMKLLKIAGGGLLMVGGVSAFSKFIVESNVIGVLISAIAFFMGLWFIGQTIE